jgi:glyoxylase-like metal-dependent hydrolase (beta-lactamase superfamily II)
MITQRTSRPRGPGSPEITGIYEPDTGSIQYVVSDPDSKKAAIIDAVWNFNPRNARTSTHSADEILKHVNERRLSVEWILDTHPHADHFMAAAYLKQRLGAAQAIGEKVREVASLWHAIYNLPEPFDIDAAFDRLFAEGDTFKIGSLPVQVVFSPGHTLASVTYVVGDDVLHLVPPSPAMWATIFGLSITPLLATQAVVCARLLFRSRPQR